MKLQPIRACALMLSICCMLPLASLVSAEPLRFGAISPLSGEGASWGVNHQRGTLLAVEERNRAGGIRGRKVEVIFEDSPSGYPRHAVSAYRKLVDLHSVKLIFGPLTSDELYAISSQTLRDKVFLVGATYMPELPDNFFGTWIDPDTEAALLARRIVRTHRRLGILSSQQSWESRVATHASTIFKREGGEVVAYEEPSYSVQDVRSEVLRVVHAKPDAVFISSYYLFARYCQELRRLGQSLPIYSIELDRAVINEAGAAAEKVTFIGPALPSREFQDSFKARWNALPDIPAAHAYDAAKIAFQAVEATEGEYEKLIQYFKTMPPYHGVTGRITTGTPHTETRTGWFKVQAGTIVPE